jgi:hypothetical protein
VSVNVMGDGIRGIIEEVMVKRKREQWQRAVESEVDDPRDTRVLYH